MGDPFRVDILVLSDYPRVLRTPRLPRGDAFSVFPYIAFPKIGDDFSVFPYKAFLKIRSIPIAQNTPNHHVVLIAGGKLPDDVTSGDVVGLGSTTVFDETVEFLKGLVLLGVFKHVVACHLP